MKRILGIVVVVVALLALAGGASGASKTTRCQAGFTESRSPSQLTVSGDSCANARKVATRAGAIAPAGCIKVLNKKGKLGFRKPCPQLGYRCTAVTIRKGLALRATCVRGARQIRFTY